MLPWLKFGLRAPCAIRESNQLPWQAALVMAELNRGHPRLVTDHCHDSGLASAVTLHFPPDSALCTWDAPATSFRAHAAWPVDTPPAPTADPLTGAAAAMHQRPA